ncbi:hypothetical protein B0T10DRAFT_538971 [Thelonectria olida]|uniref:Rhodopsin domain-containing protein n=1 Tax=Thelonectria olida TaxID=1576542 RepID=A0A9P8W1B2_9HYPO|nr:hypothetical protein B0T10DRAFT_538971 [Thelonectria olida]
MAPPTDPLVIEAFTYLALSLCLVAFRVYCQSRNGGLGNIRADDYLMILAMLPLTVETCLSYTVGMMYHGLANNNMTDAERAALSPDSTEYKNRVGGSKNQIIGWSVYTTTVWMIKLSMCAFYSRLTTGLTVYKVRVWLGYTLIIVTYVACIASILFSCVPFHKLWQINPNPGNICQPAVNRVNIFISLSSDLLTNLYLLVIPVSLILNTHISNIKKMSILILFSGGILIIAAGVLRCVLILQDDNKGPREGATWAVRESFVAVVMTNMPMTWGFLRQKLRPYFGPGLAKSSSQSRRFKASPEPGYRMQLTDQTLRDKPSRATILTEVTHTTHHTRNEVYVHSRQGSSDEILQQAAPIGGIRKDVEVIITSDARGSERYPTSRLRGHV